MARIFAILAVLGLGLFALPAFVPTATAACSNYGGLNCYDGCNGNSTIYVYAEGPPGSYVTFSCGGGTATCTIPLGKIYCEDWADTDFYQASASCSGLGTIYHYCD